MLKIRDALDEFIEFVDEQEYPDFKIFSRCFTLLEKDYNVQVSVDVNGEIEFVSFILRK